MKKKIMLTIMTLLGVQILLGTIFVNFENRIIENWNETYERAWENQNERNSFANTENPHSIGMHSNLLTDLDVMGLRHTYLRSFHSTGVHNMNEWERERFTLLVAMYNYMHYDREGNRRTSLILYVHRPNTPAFSRISGVDERLPTTLTLWYQFADLQRPVMDGWQNSITVDLIEHGMVTSVIEDRGLFKYVIDYNHLDLRRFDNHTVVWGNGVINTVQRGETFSQEQAFFASIPRYSDEGVNIYFDTALPVTSAQVIDINLTYREVRQLDIGSVTLSENGGFIAAQGARHGLTFHFYNFSTPISRDYRLTGASIRFDLLRWEVSHNRFGQTGSSYYLCQQSVATSNLDFVRVGRDTVTQNLSGSFISQQMRLSLMGEIERQMGTRTLGGRSITDIFPTLTEEVLQEHLMSLVQLEMTGRMLGFNEEIIYEATDLYIREFLKSKEINPDKRLIVTSSLIAAIKAKKIVKAAGLAMAPLAVATVAYEFLRRFMSGDMRANFVANNVRFPTFLTGQERLDREYATWRPNAGRQIQNAFNLPTRYIRHVNSLSGHEEYSFRGFDHSVLFAVTPSTRVTPPAIGWMHHISRHTTENISPISFEFTSKTDPSRIVRAIAIGGNVDSGGGGISPDIPRRNVRFDLSQIILVIKIMLIAVAGLLIYMLISIPLGILRRVKGLTDPKPKQKNKSFENYYNETNKGSNVKSKKGKKKKKRK